jgi:hypothetical protein
MNIIGVRFEIASLSCGIVTSVTLEVLSIFFGCHSVYSNYLLNSEMKQNNA